jgi:pilus assembly protein CpaF
MNPVIPIGSPAPDPRQKSYQDLKAKVHSDLLNRLNLERLTQMGQKEAEPEIRRIILEIIERSSETTPLALTERETLVVDVLNELFGLGPLEALLRDPDISDILVNRFDQVYVERDGRLELTDILFRDDRHLMQIIERIVSTVGRRIDESSPMVDARLRDGSRVNAIIPPLAIDGPSLSIRRFRTGRVRRGGLLRVVVANRRHDSPPIVWHGRRAAGAARLRLLAGETAPVVLAAAGLRGLG